MVEEGSNSNKTESEPQSVASILETEEPEKPVSQEEEEPKEQVTSLVVQNVEDSTDRKDTGESINNRDAELARVVAEKRLALIKAWEESEKTKAENRAYKRLSTVGLWEDTKKASVEAQLKKIEENLEKKKAEYVERMKNKVADIHRSGQEKRAIVEAQKKEDILEVEETAAKFRSRGNTPRRFFTCFSGKAW